MVSSFEIILFKIPLAYNFSITKTSIMYNNPVTANIIISARQISKSKTSYGSSYFPSIVVYNFLEPRLMSPDPKQ